MRQLGVFAKYWQPGAVKTRLAAHVGEAAAADLYRGFVKALLVRLSDLAPRQVLGYAPREKKDEFAALAGGWTLRPQVDGDLGERMRAYFDEAFSRGCREVVLLGSDSPNVPLEHILAAFTSLKSHDIVLGPTFDGGYYLIGARGRTPDVFAGVPWSSGEVWSRTLDRVERAGLSLGELEPWYDVDHVEDLHRLRADLAGTTEAALMDLRELIQRASGG